MSTPFSFPIMILAAGQSQRMRGRDKLMEMVDGVPLLRRQAKLARSVSSSQVLIALPPAPHPRYETLSGLDVTRVVVENAAEGMNASLRAAFDALSNEASHAMVLLADMPDLTSADLEAIADAVLQRPNALVWRGATQTGVPGHPIIFHHSLFGEFGNLSGDGGGKEVVAQAKGRICLVPLQGNRARLDLDTPEEWDDWHQARNS